MAQAGLTALDTWMSRKWREHERMWRKDERQWRSEEMIFREDARQFERAESEFRKRRRRWREEDIKQRRVDNSHYLWSRCAELNRREVDEKAEHLRLLSWLTGVITSFTMTTPVEFQYDAAVSTARLTAYAICTALVPTLMTTATMISVFLLGTILKMGKWFVSEEGEEEFMTQCRIYAESGNPLQLSPPAPRRTFDRFWEFRCEGDWVRAFRMFSWGITSFLSLLCTMGFVKFWFSNITAIFFAVIIGIFFFIWLGIKFTYGLYLRNEAHDGPALSVSRRQPQLSWPDDPFKWHIQPQKSISLASSTSLLNREMDASLPSVPWVQSLERSIPSIPPESLPVEVSLRQQ